VNSRALGRATLARQALITRATDPLAMIERLVGLQAQQARPPFVGLWTRIESFQPEQLSALLRDKAVVRATMMRGTLHLVTAADYGALRGALSPMFAAGVKSILGKRVEGLDVDKLCAFARTKLPATFEALRPALAKKFPKFDERALGYAVRMHLPLVQVPTEDAPREALPRRVRSRDRTRRPDLVGLARPRAGIRNAARRARHVSRRQARAVRLARLTASRCRHRRARAVLARLRQPRPVA
jgi:hypothetical protein